MVLSFLEVKAPVAQKLSHYQTRIGILLLTIAVSTPIMCQNIYQYGVIPSINLNKPLDNSWELNLKIESRQQFKKGFVNESSRFDYDYLLTDFSIIISNEINYNTTFGFGFLSRIEQGYFISRSIQQITCVKKYNSYKIVNRYTADQTFSKVEAPEYRFRYRASFEFPLKSQTIEPNKFYLKINNEYLNIIQSNRYDLEIRLVPLLGYRFTNKNKLECGLDYRISNFLNDNSVNKLWLNINYSILR